MGAVTAANVATVLAVGSEQLALTALIVVTVVLAAVFAVAGLAILALSVRWWLKGRQMRRAQIGDDVIAMLKQQPAQPGDKRFVADTVPEALRRITREDRRG